MKTTSYNKTVIQVTEAVFAMLALLSPEDRASVAGAILANAAQEGTAGERSLAEVFLAELTDVDVEDLAAEIENR